MPLVVTQARIDTTDGRVAAYIDLIEVGGGTQTVTVDGTPEERVHPSSSVFHVRLVSPDRMIPDQLREVGSYEEGANLVYGKALCGQTVVTNGYAADWRPPQGTLCPACAEQL
jgi:hypothetical protein